MHIGLVLTNNEIKEKIFSLEYRCCLEGEEGNQFGAIPAGEESILIIRHDSSIESVKERLKQPKNLEMFKDKIISLIYDIAHSPDLPEDRIYNIFKKINNSKNKYLTETKQAFKKIQEQKIINNSLHIIKVFNRINEIVTDMEEKIHLERPFFEVCLDLSKERGKRK